MRMIVSVIMFAVLMALLFTPRHPERATEAVASSGPRVNAYNWNVTNPDEVISNIMYIEDPRPHGSLCFAYLWGGMANGGPALANVPCAAIPRELLVTANVVR